MPDRAALHARLGRGVVLDRIDRDLNEQPHARGDRPLVGVELPGVQVDHRTAAPGAEPAQRAWHMVEVPGEVLAAEALISGYDGRVAERLRGGLRHHSSGERLVDHRRHTALAVALP